MGMTAFYVSDPAEHEAASLATMDKAVELGIVHLDTSELYRGGANFDVFNEALIAKAIAKHGRKAFIIATKFGWRVDETGVHADSSPTNVRKSCEASLARLGIDCIDLYYQHRWDPTTPIEDVMQTCKELIAEGKIKYVGLSECPPEIVRRAHAVCPISALQYELSLWSREVTSDILPLARELGIGLVAYSPLGRGALTGKLKLEDLGDKDFRKSNPRFVQEAYAKNLELVRVVEKMAADKGCSAGQLALAWVHAQGEDIFPIPGTKSAHRLEENAAAMHIKLSAEELAALEASLPPVIGDRYQGSMMNSTYQKAAAASKV